MRKKPDNYFGKAKRMFNEENWGIDTNQWSEFIDSLKANLMMYGDDRLQKEKLEAQANLRYSELRNENSAINYGLPIASLTISTIALLYSIIPTIVEIIKDHTSDAAEVAKEAVDFATNSLYAFFFLVAMVALISVICIICELIRNIRQKQIIYCQTKLRIIEIIENEKKLLSKCDVNTSNKTTKCYIVEITETKTEL
ncbi:MAG: hypothetical protein J6D45_01090 [Clostridia bacterium]|nr:hypothetical protein [Clostridia bacterium]